MISFQPQYSSFQPHDDLFGDAELARRLIAFLVARGGVRADQVRVGVAAGRVILRGCVATPNHKRLIESCSRRVAGVLGVRNEIRVIAPKSPDFARPEGRRGYRMPVLSNDPAVLAHAIA